MVEPLAPFVSNLLLNHPLHRGSKQPQDHRRILARFSILIAGWPQSRGNRSQWRGRTLRVLRRCRGLPTCTPSSVTSDADSPPPACAGDRVGGCDRSKATLWTTALRKVGVLRGGFRLSMSVAAPFVWRCLSG